MLTLHLRLMFAYSLLMSFHGAPTRLALVVACKGCHRVIPSGVPSVPDTATTIRCPACGEVRQYRPSEVYEGRAHSSSSRAAREMREEA